MGTELTMEQKREWLRKDAATFFKPMELIMSIPEFIRCQIDEAPDEEIDRRFTILTSTATSPS